jgi:serine/threonine-protein kinase
MNPHATPGETTPNSAADVLDSWKAIAQYLNKDIRTLQRWESDRNLPVHRIPGGERPSVYALKSELETWRRNRDEGCDKNAKYLATTAVPTIAVLPFLDLAGDKENEYFADGLADEVITALSLIRGLRVVARTSSFAFRGKDQDVRKIGARLGASAILEGSVRKSGNRIRVTAQLINAMDGCHIWGQRYDRDLTEVLAIQDDLSRAVIDALRVKLGGSAVRTGSRPTNPEAYELWLKGRYHTQRQTPDQILRSRSCFEQAVALDSSFPQAHLGVAESWWECAVFGLESPKEAVAVGRYALSRALDLDPACGDAYSMLGIYSAVHDFDWAMSERHFRKAIELSPDSPDIRRRCAAFLLEPTSRLSEARAQYEAALQLDPLSPVLLAYLGHCMMLERRFGEAMTRLQEAIDIAPDYWIAQMMLAATHVFAGQYEKAMEIAQAAERALGTSPMIVGSAGLIYGVTGERARAEQCLQRLQTAGELRYVSPLCTAWIYFGLGDVETALDWMQTAVEEHDPQIIHFGVKPLYDPLRGDPRFQALLQRMQLTSDTK